MRYCLARETLTVNRSLTSRNYPNIRCLPFDTQYKQLEFIRPATLAIQNSNLLITSNADSNSGSNCYSLVANALAEALRPGADFGARPFQEVRLRLLGSYTQSHIIVYHLCLK